MAQSFLNSAQDIYNILVADATFMSYLGTYTFTNDSVQPSIAVKSPGEDLPALRNVQGLECIIIDMADVSQMYYLTDNPDIVKNWQIFLIAWTPSNGGHVMQAVERLSLRFPGLTSVDTLAASDGLGALAQTKCVVPSNMPVLTI